MRDIAASVMGKTIEIFQSTTHNEAACWCGAGQVFHRIVNLKHQGIGQPAYLFEAPLGKDALLVGAMRFPCGYDSRADKKESYRCCYS